MDKNVPLEATKNMKKLRNAPYRQHANKNLKWYLEQKKTRINTSLKECKNQYGSFAPVPDIAFPHTR